MNAAVAFSLSLALSLSSGLTLAQQPALASQAASSSAGLGWRSPFFASYQEPQPYRLNDLPEAAEKQASSLASYRELRAWKERPLTIQTRTGLVAPWGLLGLSIDYAPTPRLSLEGGVGYGLFGLNLDAMGHVRLTSWETVAISVGAGVSTGRYENLGICESGQPCEKVWQRAYWLNAEAALDKRFESGLTLGARVGLGNLVNRKESECSTGECPAVERLSLPYVGLSAGFALPL